MKQRTSSILFTEIANEMAEFNPHINKKEMSISFKGDFWVNQYFYKQQYAEDGVVALASNLDFIPPDLADENMRRSLYQKTTGCSLDSLFVHAQAKGESKKIQRMEIGRNEPWEGSVLQKNFEDFYLPVLTSMLNARFCIDLLLGNEVEVRSWRIKIRYTDGSRVITSVLGAYYLAEIYQQLKAFHPSIMQAAHESLQHDSQRNILRRVMEKEEVPEDFLNLGVNVR